MNAIRFAEHGDASVLRYEQVPDPLPVDGDVVVMVKACAINGLDIYAREGGLETEIDLPHIPGADVAGEIAEIGAGVEHVRHGERVLVNPRFFCGRCDSCLRGEQTGCVDYHVLGWHRPGGYAECVSVPSANVARMPDTVTFVEAAAVPMAFTTAWRMLFSRAQTRPDETVLVLGASGGVASAAVQLAASVGARVLATTVEEKIDAVRALGADAVVDYGQESVVDRILELTGGKGVDVLVQTQGGPTWTDGLACMARFGRVAVCAAVQGAAPQEDLGTIWWKQLTIIGSTGGTPLDFRHVVSYLEQKRIVPVVDSVYPLRRAGEAQDAFSRHRHVGKVVLEP